MDSKKEIQNEVVLKYKKPAIYSVIMHNDDYTKMHFVIDLLVTVFNKNFMQAANIMIEVHTSGQAVVDSYTYDIAMTKKCSAEQLAKQNDFPLRMTLREGI